MMRGYLLSLPERVLRSMSALSAGLLRELSEVALPRAVRRTRLYRELVENTLRFLIENVGQVEGAYPREGKLADNFAMRRFAGNGIELIGLLTFRASPVWVLAALADLSGTGRQLIREITQSLKDEGLLESNSTYESIEQVLDGLEGTVGRLAQTANTPPLDVAGLRREWAELRAEASRIPTPRLPSGEALRRSWEELKATAATQGRPVFQVSSLMALAAVTRVPENLLWLSRCARGAAYGADARGGIIGALPYNARRDSRRRVRSLLDTRIPAVSKSGRVAVLTAPDFLHRENITERVTKTGRNVGLP